MANKKKEVKKGPDAEKMKTLKLAIDKIEKDFGKGTVMLLSDKPVFDSTSVSTGSLGLDVSLGIGGLPRGRVIEIYGPEASGKTTLAIHVIANVQKEGGLAAIIDAEHAFDTDYAKALGVDVDNLLISQPDYGEQALEVLDRLLTTNAMDVVVIDSVAALVPKSELEGEMGDSVTFDTPVYIRNKKTKLIEILPIKELYGGQFKFYGKRHCNKYIKTKNIEVLSHRGWCNLEAVFFKRNKNKKPIYITHTTDGYVKTTADHCLFKDKKEITIKELKIGDYLDITSPIPISNKFNFINEEVAFILGAWCGDGHIYLQNKNSNNRFQYTTIDKKLCYKIVKILETNLGIKTNVKELILSGNRKKQYHIDTTSSTILKALLESCYALKSKLKIIPKTILNTQKNIQRSFVKGFYEADGNHHSKNNNIKKSFYNNNLCIIAGIQFLLNTLGKRTSLTFSKKRNEQLTLSIPTINYPKGYVRRKVKVNKSESFLYDIQTKHGTFVSALGDIVIHNSKMGLHARLMSQALRKITAKVAKTNTIVIFINQLREKIGVMFGSPEVTTGGNALKFYASVRLDIRRIGQVKEGEENVGNRVKVKVVKNKLARPFKVTEFDLRWGTGIDTYGELVEAATALGVVLKNGSWYSYNNDKLGQGAPAVRQLLIDNQELYQEILRKVKDKIFIQ